MRPHRPILALLAASLLLPSCDRGYTLVGPHDAAGRSGEQPGESTRFIAVLDWNGVARDAVVRNRPSQFAAWRLFAYLTLAQYDAVVAAEDEKSRGVHASEHAAVAGASAAVLGFVFPADTALFEARVRAQAADRAARGDDEQELAMGDAVGRQIAARVVDRARGDRFTAQWTGTVPLCDGCWKSSTNPPQPPVLPLLGQMRPFFLDQGDEFRPAPPPAYGSPEFLAALAEVRAISDTRTTEQTRIAQYWALATGTLVSGFWNEFAEGLNRSQGTDERRAAHALALMNMASMDALIACHDAKYAYWLLRPTQADPGITLAIGLPNFPAYPSNHACASGAAAGILGHLFPSEKRRLADMAEEAGISRVYGGIHYRFDADAGLEIGRRVVERALQRDVRGHEPFPI